MQIRLVRDDDLDVITEMNTAAVPAVNEISRDDFAQFVEMAHSFLVAEVDGAVAGFVVGLDGPGLDYESLNYAWFSERYERFIYVDRIVVDANRRSGGTGQALYDAFAERGRASEHPVMLAEVNIKPMNDGSLRFHDRNGFVSVGEQDTEGGTKRVTMLERKL